MHSYSIATSGIKVFDSTIHFS